MSDFQLEALARVDLALNIAVVYGATIVALLALLGVAALRSK